MSFKIPPDPFPKEWAFLEPSRTRVSDSIQFVQLTLEEINQKLQGPGRKSKNFWNEISEKMHQISEIVEEIPNLSNAIMTIKEAKELEKICSLLQNTLFITETRP